MSDDVKKESQIIIEVPVPDKIVIDPFSKPVNAIEGAIDLATKGGKAIEKGGKKAIKGIKGLFK